MKNDERGKAPEAGAPLPDDAAEAVSGGMSTQETMDMVKDILASQEKKR